MRVKGDNLEINSGLLLSFFVLNYMIIRVKEKEERDRKGERENERTREGETKRKAERH